MRRDYIIVFISVIVIVLAGFGYFILQKDSQSSTAIGKSGYGYNPNYANAIQLKKPELCQNISYALQSGPTDGIDKVYGNEAVEICESQSKAGYFGCECDSEATLNAMRVRE